MHEHGRTRRGLSAGEASAVPFEDWFLPGQAPAGRSRSVHPRAEYDRPVRVTFPNTHMECGPSNGQGLFAPAVCGVGFGGGSAPAVVDVCVATHMRGLVPHDRVCEMRSGAVLWRRAWPPWGCSQCSLGSLLASLRRCALLAEPLRVAPTPSSRAPSSARRARGRPRPRRSSGACLEPRARASVRAAGGRCGPLGLARRGACPCVCVPA